MQTTVDVIIIENDHKNSFIIHNGTKYFLSDEDKEHWIENGCPEKVTIITRSDISKSGTGREEVPVLIEGFVLLVRESKLPPVIQHIENAIENKGFKVRFGLEQQGHISTIEAMLEEFGNHEDSWKRIGEKIGWEYKTAMCWYIGYLKDEIKKQQGLSNGSDNETRG